MNHIHNFISIVQTYDCIVYQISCSKRKHIKLGTSDIIIKLIQFHALLDAPNYPTTSANSNKFVS